MFFIFFLAVPKSCSYDDDSPWVVVMFSYGCLILVFILMKISSFIKIVISTLFALILTICNLELTEHFIANIIISFLLFHVFSDYFWNISKKKFHKFFFLFIMYSLTSTKWPLQWILLVLSRHYTNAYICCSINLAVSTLQYQPCCINLAVSTLLYQPCSINLVAYLRIIL